MKILFLFVACSLWGIDKPADPWGWFEGQDLATRHWVIDDYVGIVWASPEVGPMKWAYIQTTKGSFVVLSEPIAVKMGSLELSIKVDPVKIEVPKTWQEDMFWPSVIAAAAVGWYASYLVSHFLR